MIAAVRHLFRLFRIARTLARYDALFPFALIGLQPLATAARLLSFARVDPRVADKRPGERLALAFEALGPSFIKIGQAVSTRSDILGEDVAADLSALQDRLPPFPAVEARATIERELGRPVDELFESFDDTPVAAASIAQVHFAVTRPALEASAEATTDAETGAEVLDLPAGREVAVKVLRPGIEALMQRDLDLARWLAELVERTQPRFRRLKPVEVVETLAETVAIEMDLRLEAAAAAELRENFGDDAGYRVPEIDWQRTGRRVLTLARVDGVPLYDGDGLDAAGHDRLDIVRRSAEAFFQQVFRDGFFHGDMHPGNCFIAADGAICPVDFGIMGRLGRRAQFYLADMLTGFLTQDYARVADVHFDAGYVPATKSRAAFMQAVRSIAEPIFGLPTHEISIARLIGQLFQVTEQFEMETQPQLLLLQKTMLTAEGIGRTLAPETNMWELARPLVEDWMAAHRSPQAQLREAVVETLAAGRRLPGLVAELDRTTRAIGERGLKLDTRDFARSPPQWPLWLAVAALAVLIALT